MRALFKGTLFERQSIFVRSMYAKQLAFDKPKHRIDTENQSIFNVRVFDVIDGVEFVPKKSINVYNICQRVSRNIVEYFRVRGRMRKCARAQEAVRTLANSVLFARTLCGGFVARTIERSGKQSQIPLNRAKDIFQTLRSTDPYLVQRERYSGTGRRL